MTAVEIIAAITGGITAMSGGFYKLYSLQQENKSSNIIKDDNKKFYYDELIKHDIFTTLDGKKVKLKKVKNQEVKEILLYYINMKNELIKKNILSFINDKEKMKSIDKTKLSDIYLQFLLSKPIFNDESKTNDEDIFSEIDEEVNYDSININESESRDSSIYKQIKHNNFDNYISKYIYRKFEKLSVMLYKLLVDNFINDGIKKDIYFINYVYLTILNVVILMTFVGYNRDCFLKLEHKVNGYITNTSNSEEIDQFTENDEENKVFNFITEYKICKNDLIFEMNNKGRVIFYSNKFRTILGYGDEIINSNILNILRCNHKKFKKYLVNKQKSYSAFLLSKNDKKHSVKILKFEGRMFIILNSVKYRKTVKKTKTLI
jgi:hypothetical protein